MRFNRKDYPWIRLRYFALLFAIMSLRHIDRWLGSLFSVNYASFLLFRRKPQKKLEPGGFHVYQRISA